MKTGAKYIAEERNRQISEEGYDAEHDANTSVNHLIAAGVSYGMAAIEGQEEDMTAGESAAWWPWQTDTYKPKGTLQNLIRAGALYAAAIDRYLTEHPEEREEPELQYAIEEPEPENEQSDTNPEE